MADACRPAGQHLMAWNTAQMQAGGTGPEVDPQATNRAAGADQARIAPTRLEGIHLRGVFPLPRWERYAGQILPSQTTKSENECWRLNRPRKQAPSRPIGRPTETQGMTSTCAYYWSRPRANPRSPGRHEPSLSALKSASD